MLNRDMSMDEFINKLVEVSKNSRNTGTLLSADRYALKRFEDGSYNLYSDGRFYFGSQKVTRILNVYDENDLVSLDYGVDDVGMYPKNKIEEAGLIPISSGDIPNYFEVTDTIIIIENYEEDGKREVIRVKHEDTMYHKTQDSIKMLKQIGILD